MVGKITISQLCITGLNLYPYIRLDPRGRGKDYCLTASASGGEQRRPLHALLGAFCKTFSQNEIESGGLFF